ncbi:hypothetical protein [Bombilactobacillus thymidiniphilus]|uniref:DUF443 family protein n=1 Tax=Bombilactobacillus thymidiniphilus TaxID=2923363 RepID=A0ABY4PF75_9LACO|nr:hypothetical protein [Bombilactobacillus thymidiniphilus]UQS84171.1 hypothetical protein MOO47_03200 [Bombilactobacillus thymidiniphilus]
MSERGYRIYLVGRVSLQYYLIKYRGHYYLLDYADPKKLSSYGARGASARMTRKWSIYDVDAVKDEFCALAHKPYITKEQDHNIAIAFIVILCLAIPLLNSSFTFVNNLSSISVVLTGFVAIVMLLHFVNKPKVDVNKYKKTFLESTNFKTPSLKLKIIVFLMTYISLFSAVCLGVFSRNLLVLIISGCVMSYMFMFSRFIYFMLSRQLASSKQMESNRFLKHMKQNRSSNGKMKDLYMLFRRVKE